MQESEFEYRNKPLLIEGKFGVSRFSCREQNLNYFNQLILANDGFQREHLSKKSYIVYAEIGS